MKSRRCALAIGLIGALVFNLPANASEREGKASALVQVARLSLQTPRPFKDMQRSRLPPSVRDDKANRAPRQYTPLQDKRPENSFPDASVALPNIIHEPWIWAYIPAHLPYVYIYTQAHPFAPYASNAHPTHQPAVAFLSLPQIFFYVPN